MQPGTIVVDNPATSSAIASPPMRGRTGTPPRSGSAPIRLLRICLDERVLGAVEVNESSTLADVRVTIAEDEIGGVPETYQFFWGGAPVSRRQECRRRAVDVFPSLTIIREDSSIPVHAENTNNDTATDVSRPAANGQLVQSVADAAGSREAEQQATGPESEGTQLHAVAVGSAGERTQEPEVPLELPGTAGAALLELQITDGPLEGTTITVGEEGARIGRHTSNTLVIPEAGVSRYHCEICFLDGSFCIRDLGSTTGTHFYLRPHGHFEMFTGLMAKLGETEFQVMTQTDGDSEVEEGGPQQVVLLYDGPLAGHKVYVPDTGITIGRRHNNNLVLAEDGTVSAHHAMIFYEEGAFFLADLGSCNGTCVRMSPERTESDWHPIMDGDVLGAGCSKVRCRVHSGLL